VPASFQTISPCQNSHYSNLIHCCLLQLSTLTHNMKATILLAVCILCGESKLESGFTGASHPAPESPIAVRHERQVRSCTDDELRMRVNLARCDPNYGQRVVDIFVNCSGDYSLDRAAEMRMGGFVLSSIVTLCYQIVQL